jgi:hypothetical protein
LLARWPPLRLLHAVGASNRVASADEAIAGNEAANADSNQVAAATEEDFHDWHRWRNVIRFEDRFLVTHKDFVDTPQNHLAVVNWLADRGLTELDVTPELLEEAFFDLRSQNALQLDESKRSGGIDHVKPELRQQINEIRWDNSSPEQVYNEWEQASEQAAQDEASDRVAFETSKAAMAYKFFRLHNHCAE